MAILKDTIVSGSLRATDTIYGVTGQFTTLKIPTASNGTTYGAGTSGQVLKTNGTSVYWAADANDNNAVTQAAAITTAGAYPIIIANSTATTAVTGSVNKTSTLTYNPSTKALLTAGTVDGLTLAPQTTGFKISGGTTSKTLTVGADYTLAAACAKGVTDNSSNADVTSSDTNLITGRTLYYQLAKKGYTTNTGTVTSVQVQASSPLQSSTSTAQSSSLSTTISFVNQSANTVLAGPTSGSAAPTFRSLVAADIPNLNASKINDGTLGIARGGTNISSYAKGDILYASAANTLGKLTIGSSGQVLAVSSSGVPAWTTLPTAATNTLGMIKIGTGLNINSGVVSVSSSLTFNSNNILTGIVVGDITCDITSSSWTWRDT